MGTEDLEAILACVACAANQNHFSPLFVPVELLEHSEQQFLAIKTQHVQQDSLRVGTLNGQLTIIGALVLDHHVKLPCLRLDPSPVFILSTSIDDNEEAVVSLLVDHDVVDRASILVKHHAIHRVPSSQNGYIVREDVLHETLCLRA